MGSHGWELGPRMLKSASHQNRQGCARYGRYASEHGEGGTTGGERAAEKPGEKLAAGWSSLMGGLNERVRDAQEKVKDAQEKVKERVRDAQDNLQKSGKLDELGAGIDKLKARHPSFKPPPSFKPN